LYLAGRIGPGPLKLDAEQARRLGAVMRLREGDEFLVFSGDGREWRATVTSVAKSGMLASVGEIARQAAPLPLIVEAWCGLVRPNRFDWAIEKCVEAGADIVRPLLSEYAARGDGSSQNRQERWTRIAMEAAEQCGRLSLPVVEAPARFETLLGQQRGALILGDSAGRSWAETVPLLPLEGRITVAVGPEGGFGPDELAKARAKGALLVSFGPNILRTETAAVIAVGLVRSLGR
jgi:16S rRNA (uracil1498-N3)-methyltransferase